MSYGSDLKRKIVLIKLKQTNKILLKHIFFLKPSYIDHTLFGTIHKKSLECQRIRNV